MVCTCTTAFVTTLLCTSPFWPHQNVCSLTLARHDYAQGPLLIDLAKVRKPDKQSCTLVSYYTVLLVLQYLASAQCYCQVFMHNRLKCVPQYDIG